MKGLEAAGIIQRNLQALAHCLAIVLHGKACRYSFGDQTKRPFEIRLASFLCLKCQPWTFRKPAGSGLWQARLCDKRWSFLGNYLPVSWTTGITEWDFLEAFFSRPSTPAVRRSRLYVSKVGKNVMQSMADADHQTSMQSGTREGRQYVLDNAGCSHAAGCRHCYRS